MTRLDEVLKRADPICGRHMVGALAGQEADNMGVALSQDSRLFDSAPAAPDHAAGRRLLQRTWWRVVAPLAVLAVLGGLSLSKQLGGEALAQPATPQLLHFQHGSHEAASQVLATAAANAARTQVVGEGPVHHSVTQSWSLSTNVSKKMATTMLLTTTRELWMRPDGTGRLVESEQTTPTVAGEALEGKIVRRSGSLINPGNFANSNLGLPDDPQALAAEVGRRTSGMDLARETNIGTYILSNLTEGTATQSQQASMLAVLADVPGTFAAGAVLDRAGRAGIAVGLVTSGPSSPTTGTVYLILDAKTGLPLATETVYSPDPPRGLHLRPGPLVAEYHLYLAAGQVPEVG